MSYSLNDKVSKPNHKIRGETFKGGHGGGGGDSPPQLLISQGTREVCRAKMWNLTCENENTIIAKYYFVTD